MRKRFRQRQLTREDQEGSNKRWKELVESGNGGRGGKR